MFLSWHQKALGRNSYTFVPWVNAYLMWVLLHYESACNWYYDTILLTTTEQKNEFLIKGFHNHFVRILNNYRFLIEWMESIKIILWSIETLCFESEWTHHWGSNQDILVTIRMINYQTAPIFRVYCVKVWRRLQCAFNSNSNICRGRRSW